MKASRPSTLARSRPAALRSVNGRIGIDLADSAFDRRQAVLIDQIDLVDEDDIGERKLLLRFRGPIDLLQEMLGIRDRDNSVKLGLAADVLVDKESLCHRRGICEPRGLDHDAVEGAASPHQASDDTNKIAADRAADAAVIHLKDLFVRVDDEIVVDTDLAEFIDDDRKPLAVRLGENAVEQRRFPGAEIAGQDRDWNLRRSFRHGCVLMLGCQ